LLKADRLREGTQRAYELKLDGYRAFGFKSEGRVQLRSRSDNFSVRYGSIATPLERLPDETGVDGEGVAVDDPGKPSNALQNNAGARLELTGTGPLEEIGNLGRRHMIRSRPIKKTTTTARIRANGSGRM
jgi:hypothetical protein